MSHIDDLPPLRQVIERHGLAARKGLGQNFLLDLNITMKIAGICGDLSGATVLEIGPGPGGLTRALLASGANHVVAIEKDERCLPALAEIGDACPGRLTVISGDALNQNHVEILKQVQPPASSVKVVANLPYNVATPLFIGWLSGNWPPFWDDMVLMFQKEVAQRITATPGMKSWGRLGVLSSWRTHSQIVFDLPPQAFSPPPKVTSSVVHITPNPTPMEVSQRRLEQVTQAAFGQRRKMLRQSLKSLGGARVLEDVGIDPTLRAESLNLEDFVTLARHVETPAPDRNR